MRIGEISRVIHLVTDQNDAIVLDAAAIYGGQAYNVRKFAFTIAALDLISQQPWNGIDYSPIQKIKDDVGAERLEVQLTQADFNALNSYVAAVNQKLPIFLGTIDAQITPQDPQVINIKLPDNIATFGKLSSLNGRLEKLFKLFAFDGEILIRGFDTGSWWYVISVTGAITFPIVIGCLKIAQEFFDARTKYYDSETAKLDYEAAVAIQGREYDPKEFQAYQDKRLQLELDKKVEKLLSEIPGKNGQTEPEAHTKLVKATTALVAEMGAGVEFHLSLNPPPYASENAGSLVIDYSKVREHIESEQAEVVALSGSADVRSAPQEPIVVPAS